MNPNELYRSLCRIRIDYAKNKVNKMLISAQLSDPDTAEKLFKNVDFWTNVKTYWENKLKYNLYHTGK